MTARFYHSPPLPAIGQDTDLPIEVFHHAINVLRMKTGDEMELFDGEGRAVVVQISTIEKKSAQVTALSAIEAHNESPLNITLAQCLSVGDKMDWTIEKAVELGVHQIVPLFSNKSQIKLNPERAAKKLEHWQRIIVSACAQSGRNTLPKLHPIQAIEQYLASSSVNDYQLIFHPAGAVPFKSLSAPNSAQSVVLLIGPESGFSDKEHALAVQRGFVSTLLGPRILRTESAGLAAIAALQTQWGDF